MDDPRTKQTLDELADVFLTGTDDTPTKSASDPTPEHLRLSGFDHADNNHETDDAPDDDAQKPHAIGLEAVILGNLPGLGGAWLTQYAHFLAEDHGPIGLLHADDDALDLEVVGEQRETAPGRIPPGSRERDDLVETLDAQLTNPHQPLARMLVHIEPYRDGSIQPVALGRLAAFDRWTLLCGADDAAVVACYRLLKHLIEADPSAAPRRVAVMILGSSEIEGLDAARKVQAAAQSHLGIAVDLVGTLARMRPVRTRPVARFTPAARMWLRFRGWMDDLAHNETPNPTPLPETPHTPHTTRDGEPTMGHPAHTLPDIELEAFHQTDPEPNQTEATPENSNDPADLSGGAARSRIGKLAQPMTRSGHTPHTETTTPQNTTATPPEPDLAQLLIDHEDLGLADAIKLDATCPHQPHIKLLLDADGRLHLIQRHRKTPRTATTRDTTDTDLATLHTALLDLADARHWATEHRQLLQLTQRQCRFDPEAAPVMHLITERPDLGLQLTRRLGSKLHLHLLQHIRLADLSGYHLTPLT
ncbi:MAG: hypothetical protein RIG82_09280 [Phycisphaeraceae bacterium]